MKGRSTPAPRNGCVTIGQMNKRIALCGGDDVVVDGGTLLLARREIQMIWASITESRGSTWSREGRAVMEPLNSASHKITIRYRADRDVTSTAWIYQERRDNPPRWFKILKIGEKEQIGVSQWHLELSCRLVEKSDFAPPPVVEAPAERRTIDAVPLPRGILL